MSREIKKLLMDIEMSISTIETYLEPVLTYTAFKSSSLVIDGVHRRLSIIGEALWKADKKDKTLNISNKSKIISLRHIIVHDYDIVDNSAVWVICKNHLPLLKKEVQMLLSNE